MDVESRERRWVVVSSWIGKWLDSDKSYWFQVSEYLWKLGTRTFFFFFLFLFFSSISCKTLYDHSVLSQNNFVFLLHIFCLCIRTNKWHIFESGHIYPKVTFWTGILPTWMEQLIVRTRQNLEFKLETNHDVAHLLLWTRICVVLARAGWLLSGTSPDCRTHSCYCKYQDSKKKLHSASGYPTLDFSNKFSRSRIRAGRHPPSSSWSILIMLIFRRRLCTDSVAQLLQPIFSCLFSAQR